MQPHEPLTIDELPNLDVDQIFGSLQEEELAMLKQIFKEVESDPQWFENSVLYELYSNRISMEEFMNLLTSDEQWSYLANDQQTKKVLNLFDKVYGFA